jgi:GNAT superfamily N-acetyltransferase
VPIRTALLDDAAAIAGIHVRTWQVAYRGLMPQEYLDGLDPARRAVGWERLLADVPVREQVLVDDRDGTLVGFASVGPYRDGDLPDDVGEVRAIYVDPARWATGAGRALMLASLDALRAMGFASAALWVLDNNVRARTFYEAGAWRADGATKSEDSFGVRVSEVRYRLSLV